MLGPWDFFRLLETEPQARRFLTEQYHQQGLPQADKLAYQNCTRLVYTWKQARSYYEAALCADLSIRPLLLFYGCVQMLKGYILARDPSYPASSKMLQHGVTTRKVKRTPYVWIEDEVRPQKEGLFAHLTRLLPLPVMQNRYTVKEMLAAIPELAESFEKLIQPAVWQPVTLTLGGTVLVFPPAERGTLLYSADTLAGFLQRHAPAGLKFAAVPDSEQPAAAATQIRIESTDPQIPATRLLAAHTYFARTRDGRYLFWNDETGQPPMPLWAAHYLLMYVLGMLCRYESEWWGELVWSHTIAEVYLVECFLALHQESFPGIIARLLQNEPPSSGNQTE